MFSLHFVFPHCSPILEVPVAQAVLSNKRIQPATGAKLRPADGPFGQDAPCRHAGEQARGERWAMMATVLRQLGTLGARLRSLSWRYSMALALWRRVSPPQLVQPVAVPLQG